MDKRYLYVYSEYMAISKVLQGDLYLKLDEDAFVASVDRNAEALLDHKKIRQIYRNLMQEVGK